MKSSLSMMMVHGWAELIRGFSNNNKGKFTLNKPLKICQIQNEVELAQSLPLPKPPSPPLLKLFCRRANTYNPL